MKHKKKRKVWTKFQRAELNPTKEQVENGQYDIVKNDEIWLNSHYQVNKKTIKAPDGWSCDMIHLSIKRLDKNPAHDWRHLQWIKNELVGEENEAIEIYPAESRLIDTSNQYHLWVFSDPAVRLPLGFQERAIWEGNALGSKQRGFPPEKKPKDCINMTDGMVKELIKKNGTN